MLHLLFDATLRSTLLGFIVAAGLALWRPKSPTLQATAWTVVLAASLLMPALVEAGRLAWPVSLVAVTMPELPEPVASLPLTMPVLPATVAAALAPSHASAASATASPLTIDWALVASALYLAGVALLLGRLAIGLFLTWKIRRAAMRVDESWTGGSDVRTSAAIAVPVTLASTILLPSAAAEWSPAKRRAVLAHERAHVERHDFHIHLLAAVNRAIFWFNPLAWWLAARLADLAEAASDDAAIESTGGGASYAEILLDVARSARRVPAGVAMARPGLVGKRIERILAMAALPVRTTLRQRRLVALGIVPLIALTAVAIADPAATESKPITLDAKTLDLYVGNYEFDQNRAPNLVITISRDGDHLYSQTNSGPKFEIFAVAKGVFFLKGTEMRTAFQQSGDAPATGLKILTHADDPVSFDKGVANRVDDAELKRANEAIAQNAAAQAKPQVEVAVDPKIFDRYAGKYQIAQALFTVTHEGDYLFVQLNNQPKLRVFPESDHEFFYKVVPAQVSFVADGSAPASKLILHQNGHETVAERVDEAAAKRVETDIAKRVSEENKPRTAIRIDPKLLDDYAGHYQLAPNSVFTVTKQDDQLFVQLTGQPPIEVYPSSDHEFFYTVVNAQISFVRDDKGRVTELILHQAGQDALAARID